MEDFSGSELEAVSSLRGLLWLSPQGHSPSAQAAQLARTDRRPAQMWVKWAESKHRAQRQPCPDSRCFWTRYMQQSRSQGVKESIKQKRIKPAQIDRRTDKKTREFWKHLTSSGTLKKVRNTSQMLCHLAAIDTSQATALVPSWA